MKLEPKKLAVFVSGSGTNFEAIQRNILKGRINGKIVLVIASNSHAGAIEKAKNFGIDCYVIREKDFNLYEKYVKKILELLEQYQVEYILLAGYLKKVPDEIVKRYRWKILNIHPALLPKFGGKGMYGINVHKAVIEAGEKVTGVTIHFVDEEYDRGPIIVQKKVKVKKDDTPESLQKRVLKVEHKLYPYIVSRLCKGKIKIP